MHLRALEDCTLQLRVLENKLASNSLVPLRQRKCAKFESSIGLAESGELNAQTKSETQSFLRVSPDYMSLKLVTTTAPATTTTAVFAATTATTAATVFAATTATAAAGAFFARTRDVDR